MCDCKIGEREFAIGDEIEFDYFNGHRFVLEAGRIETVGKHGYWIKSYIGTYGTAHIRCPFKSARRRK